MVLPGQSLPWGIATQRADKSSSGCCGVLLSSYSRLGSGKTNANCCWRGCLLTIWRDAPSGYNAVISLRWRFGIAVEYVEEGAIMARLKLNIQPIKTCGKKSPLLPR